MKPNASRHRSPLPPTVVLAASLLVFLVFCWRMQSAHAQPPMAPSFGSIPGNCVAHTTFVNGGADYADDFRCAGQAIQFHTSGVSRSPSLIWAGQWLLVDEAGNFRLGLCTFNRGIHPTIDSPSTPIAQALAKDPGGAKSAYLTWRYGQTADDAIASGLWAVFHYYAQDAAGSNRATNASAPLVPSLSMLAGASGRQDLQDLAAALDAEAAGLAAPFTIEVTISPNGAGVARVRSGAQPVPNAPVRLVVAGAAFDDESTVAVLSTDVDGTVAFEIVGPAQTATVVATTSGPGPAQVYRAAAADPVGHLPQTLITGGPPVALRAEATVTLDTPPAPTTTEAPVTTEAPTTTTDAPPPTTEAPPSTEAPPPTTTTPTTTTTTTTTPPPTTPKTTTTTTTTPSPSPSPPTTTTTPPTTTTTTTPPTTTTTTTPEAPPPGTTVPIAVEQLPPAAVPGMVPDVSTTIPTALPRTGGSNSVAYLATSLLVAGIGMIGAIRRRLRSDA